MATRLSRPVYVIGVGMHPFNNQRLSSESMADVAGMAALGDAGIAFAEVGALYNGYLGGGDVPRFVCLLLATAIVSLIWRCTRWRLIRKRT